MTPISTPPQCPACGTPMVLREKEGSKFYGCPHYKECGGKTIPFSEPKPTQNSTWKNVVPKINTGDNGEIVEGLRAIWVELEKLNKNFTNFCQIFGQRKDE